MIFILPGKFHARNLLPVPLWKKAKSYKDKDEETKDRNAAASRYVQETRPKLLHLIEREMEEDHQQVEYVLRNYAEMFYKQHSETEWNKDV